MKMFPGSEFAFTHKACIYKHKTFVGLANTGPVASLGETHGIKLNSNEIK